MNRCKFCKDEIVGEFVRLDAGWPVAEPASVRQHHDVNLHEQCSGPWMLVHYPWLTKVTYRERTSL